MLGSLISTINCKNHEAKYYVLENNENLLQYICKNYDKLGQIPNNITKSLINSFISLINKGDINGLTPVHLACQYNHDFVKNLLDHNNRGRSTLYNVLYGTPYGQDTNNGMNKNVYINQIDNSGKTALYHACAWHNYNAFMNIIKYKRLNLNLVDVDQNTALHAIVANNERYCDNTLLMINYLLEKSPYIIYQINGKYDTPICIINKLLKEPSNDKILQPDRSIGFEILQILRDAHTKWINKPDDKGNTPFHFAIIPRPEFEYFQVNNLLPELDLKKNIRNFKGRTAFHDACFYYNPWVVSKLMSFSDIDINITDRGGENALHHIIQSYIKNPRNDDCLKTIHFLLKKNHFLLT